MRIKIIITLFFLLSTTIAFSQSTVYVAPNGKVLTEETYQKGKITSLENARKNYGSDYELYEKLELVKKTKDSIQYKFKWEFLNKEMLAEKLVTDKLLGTHFAIKDLNFLSNAAGKKINYEKPTFINFWFTNCIPCIEELAALNELREKYKDKVNFIAITFDDKEKVGYFLSKHKFDFIHAINEKKLTDSLGIIGYPKSFLLDKNQKIQSIEGTMPSIEEKEFYQLQLSLMAEKLNKLR